MVNIIQKNKETFYHCGDCGFVYKEKDLAQKCEDWCVKHKSCNMEITRHAIGADISGNK